MDSWAESKPRGHLWQRAFYGYFIPGLSLNPKSCSEANAPGGCGSTWRGSGRGAHEGLVACRKGGVRSPPPGWDGAGPLSLLISRAFPACREPEKELEKEQTWWSSCERQLNKLAFVLLGEKALYESLVVLGLEWFMWRNGSEVKRNKGVLVKETWPISTNKYSRCHDKSGWFCAGLNSVWGHASARHSA